MQRLVQLKERQQEQQAVQVLGLQRGLWKKWQRLLQVEMVMIQKN